MAVTQAGGDFELQERAVPEPGFQEALVKVHACGVCHSDSFVKEGGAYPITYPAIPGHEIAGEIAALGDHVEGWQVGQRVGVGWFGGNCGWCEPCRRGQFMSCRDMEIPGITVDGGYAEYVVVRARALASIPRDLDDVDAAPLMCAGITMFNSLRTSGATPGSRVAILGVGGLGHLALQFSYRLGFETVAIARGTDKQQMALDLGADTYIDSTAGDPAEVLQGLGGADVILSTITNAEAMAAVFGGLRPDGRMLVIGATMDPLPIPGAMFIGEQVGLVGHASGTSMDSEDTLRFSERKNIRPMIETVPLDRAGEAYDRMMSGDARFRMVLTMAG